MPYVLKNINLQSNSASIRDINIEMVQLKVLIGLILAKLPLSERENVIIELQNFGLHKIAEEFLQFVN